MIPPTYKVPTGTEAERRTTQLIVRRGARADDTAVVWNTQVFDLPAEEHAIIYAFNARISLTGGATETRLTRVRLGIIQVNERGQLFDVEAPNVAGRGVVAPWQTAECVAAATVANVFGFNLPVTGMLVPAGCELVLWSTTTGAVPGAHGCSWSCIYAKFPTSNFVPG